MQSGFNAAFDPFAKSSSVWLGCAFSTVENLTLDVPLREHLPLGGFVEQVERTVFKSATCRSSAVFRTMTQTESYQPSRHMRRKNTKPHASADDQHGL